MEVTFFGVRGSCPCASEQHRRFGGNTSCVLVTIPGEDPIVCDLGTGLRPLGEALIAGHSPSCTEVGPAGGVPIAVTRPAAPGAGAAPGEGVLMPGRDPLRVHALLTHLHWDHILGLPFFRPLEDRRTRVDVYGPSQPEGSLPDVLGQLVHPPFFPVHLADLRGEMGFTPVVAGDRFVLGSATVRVGAVPHAGITVGFRIEAGGRSLAYVSDHQAPLDLETVPDSVLELCDGADLLIHDAQYSREQFAGKSDWGHSTTGYAVRVAAEAGASRLALFHYDPSHTDDVVERELLEAREDPSAGRLDEILAAAEGLRVVLDAPGVEPIDDADPGGALGSKRAVRSGTDVPR